MSDSSQKNNRLLVLIVTMFICFLSSWSMMPYVPDDSYISFRYAENLVRGDGLAFNPGEQPVEAYSNLLWILVCAMLHSAGFDLPSFTPYVGALIATLNVLVLWLLLARRELSPLQILFPLLLLATSGPFIMYAISGLETPLFSLLLLVIVYYTDSLLKSGKLRDYVFMTAACGLLGLVRPEGILAMPIVAVTLLYFKTGPQKSAFINSRMKNLAIAGGIFVAMVVVYNIWRIGYFGEVLPTPFISKGGGGKSFLYAWIANLKIYFFQQGDYYTPVGYYFLALMAAAIAGRSLSTSATPLKRGETVALVIGLVYTAAYFNFKDWMPGMRYNAGLVGLFLLPATGLLSGMKAAATRAVLVRQVLVGGAIVAVSYGLLADQRVVTKRIEEANQLALVGLGKWLRARMPQDAVLGMSDVGAVPYYSGLKTIDIHPESLADLYIAKNGFSEDYFYTNQPDIVVFPSRSIFLTKFYPEHYGVAEQARFQQMYRLLGVTRYDWHNDRSYWVFVRASVPTFDSGVMETFPHGVGTIGRKFK